MTAHIADRETTEQVHEKQSLEAPEMAEKKKTFTQSAKQRSAHIKFVKKYKSLTAKRGRDDYLFLNQCPKYLY